MSVSSKRMLFTRLLPLALLSLASLAAWLVPGLLGMPSSLDSLVVIVWVVAMVLLLVDSLRRDRKRRRFLRTFYIDRNRRQAFNPALGLISYRAGDDLLDAMTVALANSDGGGHAEPPKDFVPTTVVETTEFSFVNDASASATAPVRHADDVTVNRWEGRIIDLVSDREREFSSPFDLEDVFYARSAVHSIPDPFPLAARA